MGLVEVRISWPGHPRLSKKNYTSIGNNKSMERLTIGGWDRTHHTHLLNQELGKKPTKVDRVRDAGY